MVSKQPLTRGFSRRLCTAATIAALALIPHHPALAQPAAEAPAVDPRLIEARSACAAGKVDTGIELLAKVFAETGDYTAVYNQGRCFQQNARPQQAIARFREYLRRAPDLSEDDRKEVDGFIAELDAEVARERQAAAPAQPVATVAATAAPSEPSRGNGLRNAGLIVGATGVLALGAGVYFGLRVRSITNDVERQTRDGVITYNDSVAYKSKLSDGNRAETFQYIGLGVGLGALAIGGTLFLVDRYARIGNEQARINVVPVASANTVGGILRVGF